MVRSGLHAQRESRKQMEKLKNLVEARNKREEARLLREKGGS